jgi:hypothetical protein
MKKNTLVLVLFASSVATPLFASNFISHFLPSDQQAKHAVKSNVNAKNPLVTHTAHYPNFTGEWVGVGACTADDEHDPLLIKNDDSEFTFDGEAFSIGSMTTHSSSDSYASSVDNTSANWSPDMTTMVLNFNDTSQSFRDIDGVKSFTTNTGELTFSLSNDELHINGQIIMLNNMVEVNNFPVNCTFHKK